MIIKSRQSFSAQQLVFFQSIKILISLVLFLKIMYFPCSFFLGYLFQLLSFNIAFPLSVLRNLLFYILLGTTNTVCTHSYLQHNYVFRKSNIKGKKWNNVRIQSFLLYVEKVQFSLLLFLLKTHKLSLVIFLNTIFHNDFSAITEKQVFATTLQYQRKKNKKARSIEPFKPSIQL